MAEFGAVKLAGRKRRGEKIKVADIDWITPQNQQNLVESYLLAYGNEAQLEILYGEVDMILSIPSHNKRVNGGEQ